MTNLRAVLALTLLSSSTPALGSFINYSSREINVKVVYYGAADSGAADSLRTLYDEIGAERKGKLIELSTETERTLFFDFLPTEQGEFMGFRIRLHLYTIVSRDPIPAGWRLILRGVDAVVFVFDARPEKSRDTFMALLGLFRDLRANGISWLEIPWVIQINHRQVEQTTAPSPDALCTYLALMGSRCVEADTDRGVGVAETLSQVSRLIRRELARSVPGRGDDTGMRGRLVAESAPNPVRKMKPCGAYPAGPAGSCVVSRRALLDHLRASPFAGHSRELAELALPTIWFSATETALDRLALGDSRLGGVPDVPEEFAWPRYRERPLAFLAQIRVADIGAMMGAGALPREGWLTFFYEAEEAPWGFDPKDRGSFRVIAFKGPASKLKRTSPPARPGKPVEPFTPCALRFRPGFTLPDHEDEEFPLPFELDGEGDPEEYEWLQRNIANHPPGTESSHHLLGYPQMIQGDMRLECQLVTNGLDTGSAIGYQDPRAKALAEGAGDWLLLLQIDSDDAPGWMWGDSGRLYFWIRKQDLRAERFESAWLILQCY